jgi:hypothetical protein
MVDCWEVLGRLALDAGFRAAMAANVQTIPYTPVDDKIRLMIPGTQYDAARAVIRTRIPGRPTSLMSTGELLYLFSHELLRQDLDAVAASIPAATIATIPANASPLFYSALGAMIMDEEILFSFKNGLFDDVDFGAVDQKPILTALALHLPFESATSKLRNDGWEPDCECRSIFYLGHLHPTGRHHITLAK